MSTNPYLQKIIKLTQSQYDTLASGGTVGGYTGLDDNYLYLIQDDSKFLPLLDLTSSLQLYDINSVTQVAPNNPHIESVRVQDPSTGRSYLVSVKSYRTSIESSVNYAVYIEAADKYYYEVTTNVHERIKDIIDENPSQDASVYSVNTYITSNGGTIDSGNIDFYNNCGIAELDSNDDVSAGFCIDYYGNEIIYNSSSSYRPLFVNDSYALIYSDSNDYLSELSANTAYFGIYDASDTNNYIGLNASSSQIVVSKDGGLGDYSYDFPDAGGTLALTSDITVTDVKINNTSIVSSKIANFNTKTAYNSSTNKIVTESDLTQVLRFI